MQGSGYAGGVGTQRTRPAMISPLHRGSLAPSMSQLSPLADTGAAAQPCPQKAPSVLPVPGQAWRQAPRTPHTMVASPSPARPWHATAGAPGTRAEAEPGLCGLALGHQDRYKNCSAR